MNLKEALKEALYQQWDSVNYTQYKIKLYEGGLLIAFQGSMDWRDWLLNFAAIPYKDMEEPFYLHYGFMMQYHNVRDIILGKAKGYNKVYLVGHSLGGALALICHEDLRFHYPDLLIETKTFGAPRVLAKRGNWKLFLDRITIHRIIKNNVDIKYLPTVIDVVNGNDIVPKLPFWYLENPNILNIGEKRKWYKLSIKSHLPVNYLKALEVKNE